MMSTIVLDEPHNLFVSSYQDRLRDAMNRANVTPAVLARQLGISYVAVQKTITGKTSAFTASNNSAAARYLGVSSDWLAGADSGDEAPIYREQFAVMESRAVYGGVAIPQFDTGGKMGASGLVLRDMPGEIRRLEVSDEWLRRNVPNCTSPKNLAIVTGFGDSMLGMFNPGDPLLVDSGIQSCDHDGVYFFRVGNEGFIKRLQRIPGQGILVISENRAYERWSIADNMDFQVFAKVLKAWRSENF